VRKVTNQKVTQSLEKVRRLVERVGEVSSLVERVGEVNSLDKSMLLLPMVNELLFLTINSL
jgi:hypothetical protein